jgi:hypothetical protein
MRIAIVHYSRSISYVGRKHRLPDKGQVWGKGDARLLASRSLVGGARPVSFIGFMFEYSQELP